MSDQPAGRNGDVYACDGATVVIRRTARDLSWADIKVIQPHGASWTKRQPLRDGRLPFEARPAVSSAVPGEPTEGGAHDA